MTPPQKRWRWRPSSDRVTDLELGDTLAHSLDHAPRPLERDAALFTHAPRGYSHAQAATLTTAGLTAWRALVADAGLKAGDSVLVLGTGGGVLFALQIAKTLGAPLIATSSSGE